MHIHQIIENISLFLGIVKLQSAEEQTERELNPVVWLRTKGFKAVISDEANDNSTRLITL